VGIGAGKGVARRRSSERGFVV